MKVAEIIGYQSQTNVKRDHGVPGKFGASHAEK
jgi:hypothetical protein